MAETGPSDRSGLPSSGVARNSQWGVRVEAPMVRRRQRDRDAEGVEGSREWGGGFPSPAD